MSKNGFRRRIRGLTPWFFLVLFLIIGIPSAGFALGNIAGQVTSKDSSVPAVFEVNILHATNAVLITTIVTDDKGYYDSGPLPIGVYKVRFSAPGYWPLYFGANGEDSFDLGAPVIVQEDQTAVVNESLKYQGPVLVVICNNTLSGTVTDASGGMPLAGIIVNVMNSLNAMTVADAFTDSTGAYSISTKNASSCGQVKVRFSDPNASYLPQYYGAKGWDIFAHGISVDWMNQKEPKASTIMALPGVVVPGAGITTEPAPGIDLTFDSVSTGGTVTVTPQTSSSPPSNFRIVGVNTYDINFTGTFSGPVTVCISYNDSDVHGNESNLKFFHWDAGWVDITTSLDAVGNIICGTTSHLSEFAIVEPLSSTAFILADKQGTLGEYIVTTDQPPTFRPGLGDPEIPVGTHVTISVQDGGPFFLDIWGKDGPGSETGYFEVQGTFSFSTSVEGWERMMFGRTGEFFLAEFVAVPFVYNNTANDRQAWRPTFQPGLSVEEGDEITLAGTERYVNDIDILVFQSHSSETGTTYTGTIDARVRFYENVGQGGEPGTLLWDSGVVQNIPYGERYNTFSFNVPSAHVPDTFVWTIELSNVQPANPADPYNFGLLLYDPPVVGSSGNFIWQKNGLGGWTQVTPTPYTYDYSYGARVSASALPVAQTYTITASFGAGGSITPSGDSIVSPGGTAQFNITPDQGYQVLSVIVDGANKGAQTSYTFTNVQADHTIAAYFKPITYTITASAGTGGSISSPGVNTVNPGSNMTFTITPTAGYHIQDVLVDAVSQGPTSTYPFTGIQTNHTISATFEANSSYTISASAGPNGSISPSGDVPVLGGANQKFTFTPASGYRLADVVVDGVSKGALASYTFYSVQAAHSISVTFISDVYVITATVTNYDSSTPGNGSITVNGGVPPATVNPGANITYTITPNPDYVVYNVLVDGTQQGGITTYTFTNVQANHTIAAYVKPVTYTVTASAGAGGNISPLGTSTFGVHTNPIYTITPYAGYSVTDVKVDGISKGAVTSYTFADIQANHTITATFTANASITITANATGNGTISPAGSVSVNAGANQKFTFSPAAGYRLADVVIDGVSKGALASYTFYSVQAPNHTISVTFVLDVYSINVTVATGGSVTVSGASITTTTVNGGESSTITVNPGASITFTITPDAGRSVRSLGDNGSYKYGITTYNLANIGKDHTINVYFK